MIKLFPAVIAAGLLVAGSGTVQAQQNVCEVNVAQVLAEYGVKMSDIADSSWQTSRWASRGDAYGPINGYQFSGRPASCDSGTLYVSVTTGCEISNLHTQGGCKIKGIPDHWW